MTLDIEDFVSEADGVEASDIPPAVQERLNNALADLTGGDNPTTGGDDAELANLVVSAADGSDDGSSPFATIDAALTAASADDIIFVEPGTYGQSTDSISVDKSVTLSSSEGPDVTTVESQVVVSGAAGVTISGFEVVGPGYDNGQAISIQNGASATVSNVSITDADGGIQTLGDGSQVTVDNVDVSNSVFGVGLQSDTEDAVRNSTFDVTTQGVGINGSNTVVEDNDITVDDSDGTAVFDQERGIDFLYQGGENVTIENNTIDSTDTGIISQDDVGGTITIENNTIAGDAVHVDDKGDNLDLSAIESSNTFEPDSEILADFALIVPDGGAPANTVLNVDTVERFDSGSAVQDAIDASSTGETLRVGIGTYEERPELETNDITIQGAGSGVEIDARDDSQFTNPYGFDVTADNVTLRNFTLRGPVQPSSDDSYPGSYFGLKISGSENITVEDVNVQESSLSQIDLNSVVGAELRNVTADGANDNADATSGTGLFLTNCEDVSIDGITTRNNDWGGIAVSAWQGSDNPRPDPAARDIELTGENTIEDRPLLYTEEQPKDDPYHTGSSRTSEVDTDGDSEWDVSFPLDGTVASAHDVSEATVTTADGSTGSLSHTIVYERIDNGTADQVGEIYYIDETVRDNEDLSDGNSFTYNQLGTYDI